MLSNGWTSQSPVQIYVSRCCEPSLSEPNCPLNLELAEYITQKKANTPREAAMAVVQHINNRNPHIAILAIALLRTLVQSVGYPMHLQIATKEFLNELVRRFPERPPPFPGPVMSRILELIHEWRETICKDSRWKDDMGNIRDMHRLLTFKGYRFKDLSKTTNYIANANANLKSPEELENEDREAQHAKLQELIRRGTPRDLAAAQELMKSLAGANPEAKPDYRQQTLHELEKLQSKVILLNDLLDNVDTTKGERFVQGDAYDQVATVCRQAQPKIQKWISDASGEGDEPGETESLETFLHMNDLLNGVLDRYERYKKGDYSVQAVQTHPHSSAPVKNDLINFMDDDGPSTATSGPGAATGSGKSAADDLAELFGPPSTSSAPSAPTVSSFSLLAATSQPQPSFPSAGYGFNAQQQPQRPQQPTTTFFSNPAFGGNSFGGVSNVPFGTSTPPPGASTGAGALGGIALPTTPNRSITPVAPSGSGFNTGRGTPSMGQQLQQQQQQQASSAFGFGLQPQPAQQQQPPSNQNQQAKKDPFADLAGLF
ncbi:hypothetical protein FRB90_008138 [Tulasnella sp. 427]|nr:hypothetical protein FRB90_008138 [Tulasnella sp. 427]